MKIKFSDDPAKDHDVPVDDYMLHIAQKQIEALILVGSDMAEVIATLNLALTYAVAIGSDSADVGMANLAGSFEQGKAVFLTLHPQAKRMRKEMEDNIASVPKDKAAMTHAMGVAMRAKYNGFDDERTKAAVDALLDRMVFTQRAGPKPEDTGGSTSH